MSKAWASFALLGSAATLICCVIPAVMVALGFGATLATLFASIPQLTILSEYKKTIFLFSGSLLFLVTWLRLRPAAQICPNDPNLAEACKRSRRVSKWLLATAIVLYAVSFLFAYIFPLVTS